MVQKSQGQPPGMHKNPVKNGDVYHINWLAGFLPSTVSPALGMLALEINMTLMDSCFTITQLAQQKVEYHNTKLL